MTIVELSRKPPRLIAASIVCTMMLTGTFAQAQPARFYGRLTNGDGNPIPNAVIVLCNSDANLWFMTSTEATGAFELAELPTNQFSIEVLSPQWRRLTRNPGRDQVWGYSPWTDSLTLRSGQSVQRNIQLGGLTQQPRASQTSPPCTPRRPRLSLSEASLDTLLVEQIPPAYPQNALEAATKGLLTFEAFMNKDGNVISLRLLAPSWPPATDPALTRAAVEALRNRRYRAPQSLNGGEVSEFGGQITVEFARYR